MKLSEKHEFYLARTARRLERATGKAFSKVEIIRLLLDAAILDEAALDVREAAE